MTTAPIVIPTSQRPAIQELAKLPDNAYQALRNWLVNAQMLSEPPFLVEEASKALQDQTKLGGQIVGTLIGLRSLVDRGGMAAADVASGVATDVQARSQMPPDATVSLTSRLSELLEIKSVVVASKAFSLVLADASPFTDVRIVSDVRPIFTGKDDGLEFNGSVIVHHLQVQVSEGDDQHSAMTTADLLKLKRTVERALEKDRKLREFLRESQLRPLEPSTTLDAK